MNWKEAVDQMFKLHRVKEKFDRIFRNEQNENASKLEQVVSSIFSKIDYVHKRINNLILGVASIPELVDMRLDIRGKIHDVAKLRIDAIEEGLQETKETTEYITGLKLDTYPQYFGTLDLFQQSVFQSTIVLENGEIIVTQTTISNSPGDGEHFTVNRLSRAGILLDKMEVVYGGHSTNVQAYLDNNDDIMLVFGTGRDAGYKLVRIKYEPNGRIDMKTGSYTTLPKYSSEYQVLAIDYHNDLLAVISSNGSKFYKADIYGYSAYLNATQVNPHKTIQMDSNWFFQGFAIAGNEVFVWDGNISKTNLLALHVIDIEKNETKSFTYPLLGYDLSTGEPEFIEGEGICTYVNPITKSLSIFVGVATGFAGGSKRVCKLYGWHSKDNQQYFDTVSSEKVQSIKLMDGDGYALTTDSPPTSMLDVTHPGWHYFRFADISNFIDFPDNFYDTGVSGWWLFNGPKSKGGAFHQKLERNTSTGRLISFERIVFMRSRTATEWTAHFKGTQAAKPAVQPSKLSEVKTPGDYYFNTDEWKSFTDVPTDPALGYGTSGWWVTVYKKNGVGEVYQVAKRNTIGRNVTMERVVQNSQVQTWRFASFVEESEVNRLELVEKSLLELADMMLEVE